MTYTIELPNDLGDALRAEAASVGMPESDLVRHILTRHFIEQSIVLTARPLDLPTSLEDLVEGEREADQLPVPVSAAPTGDLGRAMIYDEAEGSER
jgi:hypothetical protein